MSKLLSFLFLMAILVGVSVFHANSQLQSNEPIITDKDYIEARVYSDETIRQINEALLLEKRLLLLRQCESGDNPLVVNWNDGGSPSYSLYQYKRGTWIGFYRTYINASLTDEEIFAKIYNREDQENVTRLAIKDGMWRHWYNCATKVGLGT